MKKGLFILSVAGMLGFAACKEKGPVINFGTNTTTSTDTVYTLSTPETAEPHNILIEEFTGATCSNCPNAHVTLDNIESQSPYIGHVIVTCLHIFGAGQAAPVTGAAYDFRTDVATSIANSIYPGIPGLPCAGVDRISQGGTSALFLASWPGLMANRINFATPVNLSVNSSYDGTKAVATLKVHISYTQAVADSQRLSLAIVEDSITDFQEYPTYIDSAYSFNGILRDMVTDINGVPILDTVAQKPAGLTLDRTYIYKFDLTKNPSWKPEHCRVVAFVHKSGTTKDVLQSATANIRP